MSSNQVHLSLGELKALSRLSESLRDAGEVHNAYLGNPDAGSALARVANNFESAFNRPFASIEPSL
ncbi:MAG: hypothetical protein GC137_04565 [Alphaproteobacteria bacterium]|nr:hypothetical protein [Alphaproteobacteria bacterium]